MSAKKFLGADVLPLIGLEISMLNRYFKDDKRGFKDKKDAVSLIYFALPDSIEYSMIFEKILRQTDAVVQEGNHCIAVLYGTDRAGASILLEGIQEFLGAQPIDLVVSYPKDASSAHELITKFQDEIRDNYGVILECLKIEKFEIYEI